ncbi:hypothetical protein KL86PLE_40665 [uncultured Pleomorphomonas sp.]|uniref:Uncharacterized protein n=1 Tax=uncultured Pleomorphomonas sp. TaxID=442121 RepID=A0A212LH95_9HYPH|nr:hypothetical protein KL86PLE_40665 [uncultured Pleomorphomonas sp.]
MNHKSYYSEYIFYLGISHMSRIENFLILDLKVLFSIPGRTLRKMVDSRNFLPSAMMACTERI